jgi:hypothetical protein
MEQVRETSIVFPQATLGLSLVPSQVPGKTLPYIYIYIYVYDNAITSPHHALMCFYRHACRRWHHPAAGDLSGPAGRRCHIQDQRQGHWQPGIRGCGELHQAAEPPHCDPLRPGPGRPLPHHAAQPAPSHP